MTKTQTRQSKRTPVTLKIKFKSATIDQFIERYAIDVSQGGIFIRTKDPLPVGTTMRFEFQLRDASPLITGEGTVVWIREHSPNQTGVAPGMGVRFDRLTESSQAVLDEILSQKALKGADDGEQQFNEQPTRVAPSPLVDDLAKESKLRQSQQSLSAAARKAVAGKQPAQEPVPFQSDADEFSEDAFEQATKVRSLDDLAAASAHMDLQGIEAAADSAAAPATAETAATTKGAAAKEPAPGDATEDGDGDDGPISQADDRAQTTIFPSQRRLRPMIGGAMAARAGAAHAPPSRSDAAGPGGKTPGSEREGAGKAGRIELDPLADASAVTSELPGGALVDEPTQESLLAAERPLAPESVPAPGDAPAGQRSGRRQSSELSTEASGSTSSKDRGVAAAEARPPTARVEIEGKPAVLRSPASAEDAAPSSARDDAKDDDKDDDLDDEELTQLLEKPQLEDDKQPARSGSFPGVAVALVLLLAAALGGGGYYFLFVRGGPAGEAPGTEAPGAEAAAGTDEPGEAAGTDPEAGDPEADDPAADEPEAAAAAAEPPDPVETVSMEVRSTPKGALAELVDGAQEGPTPMTFEVDEARTHRVRITHPGFVAQEITLDPAGSPPERVELQPAPWIFRLSSVPDDTVVYIDGRRVPGTTPNEMELPPGWNKKKRFKVSFRKVGYEKLDVFVDNEFQAEPDAMVQSVTGTMVERTEPEPAEPERNKPEPASSDDEGGDEDGAQQAPADGEDAQEAASQDDGAASQANGGKEEESGAAAGAGGGQADDGQEAGQGASQGTNQPAGEQAPDQQGASASKPATPPDQQAAPSGGAGSASAPEP